MRTPRSANSCRKTVAGRFWDGFRTSNKSCQFAYNGIGIGRTLTLKTESLPNAPLNLEATQNMTVTLNILEDAFEPAR